jgi:tetratricopeptide (TPR) repeat protein
MLKELQSGPLGKRQVEFYYTPDSLAFRLHRGRRSYHPLAPIDFANLWEQESWDPICDKVRKSYRLVWMERGRYLERHGRIPDAIAAYQAAAAIPPRSEKAVEALQRLGAAPE